MKNLLVLTTWTYRSGLIHAYTLPYLRQIHAVLPAGSNIHLVTLEQESQRLGLPEGAAARDGLAEDGIIWHPFPYHRFGLWAMLVTACRLLRLLCLCLSEKVRFIHCFCTPAGALGWMLSSLTGIPLIIDSYEPHAEAMVENGTWKKTSLAYRLLFCLERRQSLRAAAVIATTQGMRDYALARYGARFQRFFVKPACVDLELFTREGLRTDALAKELGLDGKVVGVYAGKTGGIYLEGEIFDLFKAAHEHWGDSFRALLLTADEEVKISALCSKSGLARDLVVVRSAAHDDMPRYLALADFALTPVKSVPTKRLCAPIKDGEYWAMGLPVIITANISDDSGIIKENAIGSVLEDLSQESYRRSIREIEGLLLRHPKQDLRLKIRAVAERTRGLGISADIYRALYA